MAILLIVILIGLIPAAIAKNKGQSFVKWWIYGTLLFIIALPHAFLLKQDHMAIEKRLINEGMKKCPHCAEIIKGDAKVCRYCGRDVGDVVPVVAPDKSKFRLTTVILGLILLALLVLVTVSIIAVISIHKETKISIQEVRPKLNDVIPQFYGWVNDFANVIDKTYKDKLNSLVSDVEHKSTAEIAVVTQNSIAPYDEKEYAYKLFNNWKIGKADKNNGVLVLLVIKERRWRIETGLGMQNILSDRLCEEISNKYMVPYFKAGEYGEGLYYGVSEIAKAILRNNSKK